MARIETLVSKDRYDTASLGGRTCLIRWSNIYVFNIYLTMGNAIFLRT